MKSRTVFRMPFRVHSGRDCAWTQLLTGPGASKKSKCWASWNLNLKCWLQATHGLPVWKSSAAQPWWGVCLGLFSRCLSTGHQRRDCVPADLSHHEFWPVPGDVCWCVREPFAQQPWMWREGAVWKLGQKEEPWPRLSKAGVCLTCLSLQRSARGCQ